MKNRCAAAGYTPEDGPRCGGSAHPLHGIDGRVELCCGALPLVLGDALLDALLCRLGSSRLDGSCHRAAAEAAGPGHQALGANKGAGAADDGGDDAGLAGGRDCLFFGGARLPREFVG
ncbi:hypothetical protein, partial [Roseateles sp.]|uniref:hypothetical protein n=1 Tax=Roseateles sp. TaxID=1971397 RepID=UPI002E0BB4B4|nr:hypothetical protein [Roseateles sp.]